MAVDELEWPRPHPQNDVPAARLSAALDEPTKTRVGERACHVREHLDDGANGTHGAAAPRSSTMARSWATPPLR